jgi:hypothetical protein
MCAEVSAAKTVVKAKVLWKFILLKVGQRNLNFIFGIIIKLKSK